jgi:hypothetical protein
VAFCAGPETGKSTLAYGLGHRGYALWADDALVFHAATGLVEAVPLPFRMRLRPPSRAYFAQRARGPEDGRPARPRRRPRPLAAVFVLERAPCRPGISVGVCRLSAPLALPAVLAHAHSFSEEDPTRKRRLVDQYLALVAAVPVFRLRFVPDLERLDHVLDQVEKALA